MKNAGPSRLRVNRMLFATQGRPFGTSGKPFGTSGQAGATKEKAPTKVGAQFYMQATIPENKILSRKFLTFPKQFS
jgi:hypothetical protein